MTTPAAPAPPGEPAGTAPADRPAVPAAERGATVIPDKVVARIAVRAAREALAAYAAPSPSARAGPAAPQASVAVGGGAARLALTVDLPYPADLARVSRQVRDHVRERVALLTGMRVTEVTLVIEHLLPSGGLESRRVR